MRSAVLHSLILLSFVLMTSCSPHSPAPVKEVKPRKYNRVHQKRMTKRFVPDEVVVRKGDTLYALGFKYSIDYKKLASINRIKSPYNIYPGQKLRLKKSKGRQRNQVAQARSHPVRIKPKPIGTVVRKTTPPAKIPKQNYNKKPAVKKPIQVSKKPNVTKPVAKKPVTKPVNKPQSRPIVKKPVTQPVKPASSKWVWPLNGRVISTFSAADVSRKGIDISASQGTTVVATNNGTVVYSGDGLRGYGELIIIKHTDNLLSAYAHNSQRLVKEGQTVKQGQHIAKSGKGNDGKSLLHFEIRKNGQPVNPLKYLPKK